MEKKTGQTSSSKNFYASKIKLSSGTRSPINSARSTKNILGQKYEYLNTRCDSPMIQGQICYTTRSRYYSPHCKCQEINSNYQYTRQNYIKKQDSPSYNKILPLPKDIHDYINDFNEVAKTRDNFSYFQETKYSPSSTFRTYY